MNAENKGNFAERVSIGDNVDGLACLGFVHDDIFIVDPYSSECSRFPVDPVSEYGLTEEQAKLIQGFNEALDSATLEALNAGALKMQEFLGVTTGDFAGMYFSDSGEVNRIRHALADYALEQYKTTLRDQAHS